MQPFAQNLRENAPLAKTNWFRVGGPAQFLFRPENTQQLAAFLRAKPPEIPVTILGVGSNVIIRDGGIDGVVIKLGREFAQIGINESLDITVGAACLDLNAARFAESELLTGLEFLSGIPGTIGGAVAMNAGAYGSDIAQVLVEAEIVTAEGDIRTLSCAEIGFSYRHSHLPPGAIVTSAILRAAPGDAAAIATRMADIQSSREATQPIRSPTGGSTFKNPPGHKAWELIDRAGCRGLTMGGAMVSEKHCNFLINTGSATAAELEGLGEEVIRRVAEASGITLEWEIKRIGITK